MTFRTEFIAAKSQNLIDYNQKILLLGSCFSDNIGYKLHELKFQTLVNPFGTAFSAASIANLLKHCNGKEVAKDKTILIDGLYRHFDFHSKYNNESVENLINSIYSDMESTKSFLKVCDVAIITLGTSWVYQLQQSIVANCHKAPQSLFQKSILSVEENIKYLMEILNNLIIFNPNMKVIFTVSPVRHIKDGIAENGRSKANLISAIHEVVEKTNAIYFPAYEIMMDDLRDYRFYDTDLIHPGEQGIEYIWEKFIEQYFSSETQNTMKEVNDIIKFENHRPVSRSKSYIEHETEINVRKGNLSGKFGIKF